MEKDFSGKKLSSKTHKVLLILNIVIFIAAACVLAGSILHDEVVSIVAMLLVMVASAGNAIMSWLRLKGKKL